MRISHVSWLLSSAGGGIPPAMMALAEAQRAAGTLTRVLGVADPAGPQLDSTVPCSAFPARGPLALGWAPGLAVALQSDEPDMVHLHGLFTWSSHAARMWRRRTGRPLVVTPHGMLEPWALANSAWKKKIFSLLVERDNLRGATCLQALSEPEAKQMRRLGLRNPIAVVPNGVDLSRLPAPLPRSALDSLFPAAHGRRILLFLARVHPKKGLLHLLEAWATVRAEGIGRDWQLLVAGPDQLGHSAEVCTKAHALGLADQVCLTGPLSGERKCAALSAAEGFILPSFSEGFSMAVLEAMAYSLPVLLTRQCNLDAEELGAGLLCQPDADSVAEQLRTFFSMSDSERCTMGERGRRAVESRYTWRAIAHTLNQTYAWVLGGGQPPDWIRATGRALVRPPAYRGSRETGIGSGFRCATRGRGVTVSSRLSVCLAEFDNAWYEPGRTLLVRILWLVVNCVFLSAWFPWPSRFKCAMLRLFGATVGQGVVLKPRVNVKYPWNLAIGDDAWIGEGVWIDSLARVTIGSNACLSQGCMIETGNHDWSTATFDLRLSDVIVEDGAWAAVRSLLLPGSRLATHAVLGAGSVLAGDSDPYGVYVGNPARWVKERVIKAAR